MAVEHSQQQQRRNIFPPNEPLVKQNQRHDESFQPNESRRSCSSNAFLASYVPSGVDLNLSQRPSHGQSSRLVQGFHQESRPPSINHNNQNNSNDPHYANSTSCEAWVEILQSQSSALPFLHPELQRVEVFLRRSSSPRQPWGMSVSVFDSSVLLISDVEHRSYYRDRHQSTSFLYPGDAVFSINNIAISEMKTLSVVTSYLGSVDTVRIVALRLPSALHAARQTAMLTSTTPDKIRNMGMDILVPQGTSIANAAYREGMDVFRKALVYRSVFVQQYPPPPPVYQPPPQHHSQPQHHSHPYHHQIPMDSSPRTVVPPPRNPYHHYPPPPPPQATPTPKYNHGPPPCFSSASNSAFSTFVDHTNGNVAPWSSSASHTTTHQHNNHNHAFMHGRQALYGNSHGATTHTSRESCVKPPFTPSATTPVTKKDPRVEFEELLEITDPDRDGGRASMFLDPTYEQNYPQWLTKRKAQWRKTYTIPHKTHLSHSSLSHHFPDSYFSDNDDDDDHDDDDFIETLPAHNFWHTSSGHPTFQSWLSTSQHKWKKSYSWNVKKRQRLAKDCEEVVRLPLDLTFDGAEECFCKWLRVRRNQWKIMRRKRQRRLEEGAVGIGGGGVHGGGLQSAVLSVSSPEGEAAAVAGSGPDPNVQPVPQVSQRSTLDIPITTLDSMPDVKYIDALLEEEELKQRELDSRPPLDITFLFDGSLGAPDDVICYCFKFLHPSEHGKLLCISLKTSNALKERIDLWRNLCPSHWTLPKRPRKPWHVIYITKLRSEQEEVFKRSDEVLSKATEIMTKGDHLNKVEKLVRRAEKTFGFHVDYVSAVVLERNSLLNFAVINGRHKIAKWLIEVKRANIETFDRGQFTPLINAAWSGDKYMVRYLLSKGANRKKAGTGHYTQKLASPDFKGMTAEGWARKKGHKDLADLICLGLG